VDKGQDLPPGGGRRQRGARARRRAGRLRAVRATAHGHGPHLPGLLAGLAGGRAAPGRRDRHGARLAFGTRCEGGRRDRGRRGGAARGAGGLALSFLSQTWGTWLNVATVVVGGGLGLLLRGRLPERITLVVMQAIGLVTVLIGVMNALDLGRVDEPPG